METFWFIAVAAMIAMYVLLDGFDLGSGAIHLVAARNERERRTILRAIGPVWDGNEVWLIAAGGSLFFAFPLLYASGFSGFYLPLTIVLWLLMIRGLSVELRTHFNDPLWAQFWDFMFFLGSSLLAIFFGAALGNVVRGVPLSGHKDYFFQPLWTNFSPFSQEPGILDWYTMLVAVLALVTLIAHGANWISLKTEHDLNARSRRISFTFALVIAALTVLITPLTFWVSPWMFDGFLERPYGFVLPLVALGGLAGMVFNLRNEDRAAFLSSGTYILGMLTSTVFGVYPRVLPAVNPENSLTIYNASSSQYSQTVGLMWWSIGIILAAIYFIVIYRLFRGKVSLEDEGY
jgi:cytochrome d ubiquinol oxidase subunit II